jgi:hypothetical protein
LFVYDRCSCLVSVVVRMNSEDLMNVSVVQVKQSIEVSDVLVLVENSVYRDCSVYTDLGVCYNNVRGYLYSCFKFLGFRPLLQT